MNFSRFSNSFAVHFSSVEIISFFVHVFLSFVCASFLPSHSPSIQECIHAFGPSLTQTLTHLPIHASIFVLTHASATYPTMYVSTYPATHPPRLPSKNQPLLPSVHVCMYPFSIWKNKFEVDDMLDCGQIGEAEAWGC